MKLQILNNIPLKENRFLLELLTPSGFGPCAPGQFMHLRIEDSCDPLLRRPFSIHDFAPAARKKAGVLKILYETVGKGSTLLSQKKPLSEVDALGPLGHGFDLEKIQKAQKIYIVAGGMGIAPLFFLTKKLATKKPVVLLGARTKNQLLAEKELKKLKIDVLVSTDDGSKGMKGRVTDLLRKCFNGCADHESTVVCVCGPKPMLAATAELGRQHRASVYVSMEEFMGCGLGACLGCVIRSENGYKRICHDGPVFDSREIVW